MAATDSKTRILDAAQAEFSEYGYHGTSIRNVAGRAGVQIAAIRYHIGSKDDLFRAVFERHANAVLDRRKDIEAAQQQTDNGDQVEDVIEAMIGPVLDLRFESDDGARFAKLMANIVSSPDDRSTALTQEIFDPSAPAIIDRLTDALPALDPRSRYWAYFLAVGCLAMACSNGDRLHRLSRGASNPENRDEAREMLFRFIAGGAHALARR